MTPKQFGTSQEEQSIQDKIKAREIVQTVLQYGINQQQLVQLVYLFSLEIEDIQLMKSLTSLINQSREGTKSNIITGE